MRACCSLFLQRNGAALACRLPRLFERTFFTEHRIFARQPDLSDHAYSLGMCAPRIFPMQDKNSGARFSFFDSFSQFPSCWLCDPPSDARARFLLFRPHTLFKITLHSPFAQGASRE